MSNEASKKPKIEAIYPLSVMQQGILFHHLTVKDDQGFLNVQCVIDGNLDVVTLKKAWALVVKRHPILRTSVHWKKIKSPIQLVKPKASMEWEVMDWTNLTLNVQQQKLTELKDLNKKEGINFQKQPLAKISLIKTKPNSFYFIWCCHHLLLDGWSSSIIIKDVFAFYEALTKNENANLETIPSYKSYLNWLNQIKVEDAKKFWAKTFQDFETPFLFNKNQTKISTLVENHVKLSEETTLKAQELAKFYQVTSNTLFQGIWSIILAKYSNSKDVTYGNTVSGRSGNFPNIELVAGMFTNVLPVRTKLNGNSDIKNWLKDLQTQQLEARKFEKFTIGELSEWIGNTTNTIFDNLFIFENYPWDDIKVGDISVHSSESGITTTYPLTITIKAEDTIGIHLLSEESLFSNEANHWILSKFEEILNTLHNNKSILIEGLLEKITSINSDLVSENVKEIETPYKPQAPKNKTELELLKIWETLLNKNNIGTQDRFFEIGGKSLLAIKMFTQIEKKLKLKISPITLLEYPTIESLSKFITEDKNEDSWDYVVPIKSAGNKNPLFCIHGGGGYVFFFNPIANALDKDRPVYAIQPSGITGNQNMHKSMQEMAKDYAKEIKDIQPKGPYNLLVYCFSPAVGIEIADEFKKLGEKTNLIVIDSIIKQENFTDPTRIKMRIFGFLNRLKSNPANAIKLMVANNYERFFESIVIKLFASSNKKNLEKIKQNLIKIYKLYKWDKKHSGTTTLILTEKPDKKLNTNYIEAWEGITSQEVNILYTKGQHHQLFTSPYADFMADKIEIAIIENN